MIVLEPAPDFLFSTKSLEHLKEENSDKIYHNTHNIDTFSSNMNVNTQSLVGAKICFEGV